MKRWTFAFAALAVPVALAFVAARQMEKTSEGACIGCGLVVMFSIPIGIAAAVTVFAQPGPHRKALVTVVGAFSLALVVAPLVIGTWAAATR